ncbi:MAG: cobalt ECF transporter T component CbiQ [Deltaproteobacteria bacterium]|nr:cobalt ECF transporter T component CbiQ [Deltaproteobacteria bacterium]
MIFDNGYINGNSVIHSLDPRVKIMTVAAFSVVIAVCSRWAALIPGLFLSLLFVLFARVPLKNVFIRLIPVNGLIVFLWLFLPFSFEGKPIFTIGPLVATEEGVLYAMLLTIRSNIILLALISLVSTTSIFTLGRAMGHLRIPGKMVQLFFFTYRYLHVIQLEYQRMVNALKIRGFQSKTGMHAYRTYAYLVGMLLLRSYDRSERIRNAMLCRGFKGHFYDLSEFSLKPFDFITLFFMFLALGIIALLQWTRIIY